MMRAIWGRATLQGRTHLWPVLSVTAPRRVGARSACGLVSSQDALLEPSADRCGLCRRLAHVWEVRDGR